MAIGDLRHVKILSYCKRNNPVPYVITNQIDEVVKFIDEFGNELESNFVTIESIDSPLFICLNDGNDVIFIPSGHVKEISYQRIKSFTIIGSVGQKYRWYVQNF